MACAGIGVHQHRTVAESLDHAAVLPPRVDRQVGEAARGGRRGRVPVQLGERG